jgi:hypothetical protein
MRVLASALFAIVLGLGARAQGLLQLGFTGKIDTTGGARVVAEISFLDGKDAQEHTIILGVHLAENTGAADFTALLSDRLRRGGVRVLVPGAETANRSNAMMFIEDCTGVALRLGRGLSASVTACEEAPVTVRLLPPQDTKNVADLLVTVTTFQPHMKEFARQSFSWSFDEKHTASDVATKLVTKAIDEGWTSELGGHDTWRPGNFKDGSQARGTSIELRTQGDWRLEVTMPSRRNDR